VCDDFLKYFAHNRNLEGILTYTRRSHRHLSINITITGGENIFHIKYSAHDESSESSSEASNPTQL
jgi:hypothetical protein